jgi:hypothetical protein
VSWKLAQVSSMPIWKNEDPKCGPWAFQQATDSCGRVETPVRLDLRELSMHRIIGTSMLCNLLRSKLLAFRYRCLDVLVRRIEWVIDTVRLCYNFKKYDSSAPVSP